VPKEEGPFGAPPPIVGRESRASHAANPEGSDYDDSAVSRRSWVVLGALAGAPLFGFVALLVVAGVRAISSSHYTSTPWGTISILIGGVAGLFVGEIVGSRARVMTPRLRDTLVGIGGAVFLGTAGGFIGVLLGLWHGYDNHGTRDFVIGAIPGAITGLAVGRLFGARVSGAERSA
jgi:hypothetical protein